MTALKLRISCKQKCDRNVCELWIAEYGMRVAKALLRTSLQFRSTKFVFYYIALKWFIVLRSTIKTRDQTHPVLKNALAAS